MARTQSYVGAALLASVLVPAAGPHAQAMHPLHRQTDTIPTTAYASVGGSGVFSSSDPAGSWTGPSTLPSDATALAAGDSSQWRTVFAALNSGVSMSRDGGTTWNTTLRGHRAVAVILPSGLARIVLVATDDGIFRSSDEGTTWTSVTNRAAATLAQAPQNPLHLYAAGPAGQVWTSRDGGVHWSSTTRSLPHRVTVLGLAVSATSTETVFAATSAGIWRFSGSSWSLVGRGLAQKKWTTIVANGTELFATAQHDSALYTSTNDGGTWVGRSIADLTGRITVLAQDTQQPTTLAVGDTNGTVRFSTDSGVTWSAAKGTVAGAIGNPVLAIALTHRQTLPVDGVADPHKGDIRYFAANGGHTLRGAFLDFWLAHASLLGAPLTEQFTDQAHGDVTAQYFENMELLQGSGGVSAAPLGLENLPAGFDGRQTFSVNSQFQDYWTAHGGSALLGTARTPLIKEGNGDGSGVTYPVQYFRNARLEYHSEVGSVTVSKLGEQDLTRRGWI